MNLNVEILHEIFYSLFGLSPGSSRAVHESDVLRFPRLMIICAEIPSPKIRFCERPDLSRGGSDRKPHQRTAFMFGSYLKSLYGRPCVTRATNLTRQSLQVSVKCEKKKR